MDGNSIIIFESANPIRASREPFGVRRVEVDDAQFANEELENPIRARDIVRNSENNIITAEDNFETTLERERARREEFQQERSLQAIEINESLLNENLDALLINETQSANNNINNQADERSQLSLNFQNNNFAAQQTEIRTVTIANNNLSAIDASTAYQRNSFITNLAGSLAVTLKNTRSLDDTV